MVKFSSAPIEEVAPKRGAKQPSKRAAIQRQYQEALNEAIDANEALIVEIEPDDKALTIRNRIYRAAEALGIENVKVRRRSNRVIAYIEESEDA